jgi:hypothetical protein
VDLASPEQRNNLQLSVQAVERSSPLRFQPGLTRQPIRLEPVVILVEFRLGFLAGVVRKKLGLNLVSEPADKGRVYRIKDGTASSAAVGRAKKAA